MGPFYRRTVQYSTVQYGTLPYLHRTVRAYWVGDIFCGVRGTLYGTVQYHGTIASPVKERALVMPRRKAICLVRGFTLYGVPT